MTKYKRRIQVFFDASVIFSAIYSTKGGSAKVAALVKAGKIIGITTQTVIEEVTENVYKMKNIRKDSIEKFIVQNNFYVREAITIEEIKPYAKIVEQKDAHVLAGAYLTRSDYLVTLDKKHLDNISVQSKLSSLRITSPKNFLQQLKTLL